jgi:C_GCAxxG_C_C family probable redox protein
MPSEKPHNEDHWMTKRAKTESGVLNEAYRRGYEYMAKYSWPCAPAVFAAVMDTLGYEDDPVINEVWKSTIGFTGGTGNMAIGTCGAMDGAAAAISYSFGLTKADANYGKMIKVIEVVAEVGRKMQEKYGHIQCQEVQFHHWGKSYRFTHAQAREEFMNWTMDKKSMAKCQEVTGDLARWSVEKILEHNPQFSKREHQ